MSKYVPKSTYPSGTPTATIYIDGLLGLCFNDNKRCTVGVNKQTDHALKFGIWKWTPSSPPDPRDCEEIDVKLPTSYQRVEINVKKAGTKAVNVYSGPTITTPHLRNNFVTKCVDLEGDRGHKQSVKNKLSTLWPRFYINDGLFCAYKISTALFDLKDPDDKLVASLDEVSLAIAADIFLATGDSIEIIADGKPLTPTLPFGARYEIGITNLCNSGSGVSDFHQHYEVLEGLHKTKYHLKNRLGTGSTDPVTLGHCVSGFHPVSDRAPCMAVVFGDTTDFVD